MHKNLLEKLLFELVKNSKRSDRELSKVLKVSQPTITRARTKLEKEKFVRQYTVFPDFAKIGFELVAFNFATLKPAQSSDLEKMQKMRNEWAKGNSNVIFEVGGEGLGANSLMISIHRNYTEFASFITKYRTDWANYLQDLKSFIVSIPNRSLVAKDLSFDDLGKMSKS
jgi:DNA-binding Lrp family transcriptional regulator